MSIQEELLQAYELARGAGEVYLDTLSNELGTRIRSGKDLLALTDRLAMAALKALPRHSARPVPPQVALALAARR